MKNSKTPIATKLGIITTIKVLIYLILIGFSLYFLNEKFSFKQLLPLLTIFFILEFIYIYSFRKTINNSRIKVYLKKSTTSLLLIILSTGLQLLLAIKSLPEIQLIYFMNFALFFSLILSHIYSTYWVFILENDTIYKNSLFNKQIPFSSISKMKITVDKELLIYYGDNKNIIPTLNEEDSLDLMNRILEKYPVEIIEN